MQWTRYQRKSVNQLGKKNEHDSKIKMNFVISFGGRELFSIV